MDSFIVTKKKKSVSRQKSIRISPESYDRLMELSEESGLSFNKVIGQCIEYALSNMEE